MEAPGCLCYLGHHSGGPPLPSSRRRRATCGDLSPPLQDTTPTGLWSPGRGTQREQRGLCSGLLGGGELGWLAFLGFSASLEYSRLSTTIYPGGAPSSTTLQLRSGRGAPGHRGLSQGLRRDGGGVWGCPCRRRRGRSLEEGGSRVLIQGCSGCGSAAGE